MRSAIYRKSTSIGSPRTNARPGMQTLYVILSGHGVSILCATCQICVLLVGLFHSSKHTFGSRKERKSRVFATLIVLEARVVPDEQLIAAVSS